MIRKDALVEVSVLACLLHAYGLTACDDYGRISASARYWMMNVCPNRASLAEIAAALDELVASGALVKYGDAGDPSLLYPDWFETQTFQNNFVLRALRPNPETGECEPPVKWSDIREAMNLRRRAPRANLTEEEEQAKAENVKLSKRKDNVNQVVSSKSNKKEKNTDTTTTDLNLTGVEPLLPYWEGCGDPLVVYVAEAISKIGKYANASRPPTIARLEDLVGKARELAPDDKAVQFMVDNWKEFHLADVKAKYGKQDPVASLREQIGYYRPRWAQMRRRMAPTQVPTATHDEDLKRLL